MTKSNTEVGAIVYGMVENISASVSGALTDMVNNNVYFAELITGNSIPVSAIGKEYQPGIISLTVGNVLSLMSSQGIGTESVKLGELGLTKGIDTSSHKEWKNLGIQQLKEIGEKISFFQVWTSNA